MKRHWRDAAGDAGGDVAAEAAGDSDSQRPQRDEDGVLNFGEAAAAEPAPRLNEDGSARLGAADYMFRGSRRKHEPLNRDTVATHLALLLASAHLLCLSQMTPSRVQPSALGLDSKRGDPAAPLPSQQPAPSAAATIPLDLTRALAAQQLAQQQSQSNPLSQRLGLVGEHGGRRVGSPERGVVGGCTGHALL